MQLTEELKSKIDNMTYEQLLARVRFDPAGSDFFQDESGTYALDRMKKLRSEPGGDVRHTAASKSIGWE